MRSPVKIFISAAFVCGVCALAPNAASAMPMADRDLGVTPLTQEAHAVRVCGRYRCWWTYAGHYHGRYGYGYGYGHPAYWRGGYRYGWRHPGYGWHGHHYGYGWRGHGWGGHGWGGHGWGGRGWGGHGHWR